MDFSTVDHSRSEQLYLQIRRLIVQAIQAGALLPGQQIPSIAAIASTARVSRMTVRHALETLIHEGWIHPVPGKGSFVTRKTRIVLDLQHVIGWADEVKMQGQEPSARLVGAEIVPVEPRVAHALGLAAGTPVYRVIRVQYAGETPLGIDTTYLPTDRFPNFPTYIAASPSSISRVLLEKYGVRLVHGTQLIEAVGADRPTAEMIGIPVGSPVLAAERTAYTADDTPVQFVRSLHRSDMVSLKVKLTNTFALSH
jgi:GntR family transcriptional regulator